MQSAIAQQSERGDPSYSRQWHLKNTGQNGTPGIDINVEPVWNTTLTSGVKIRGQGIYISIVDTDLQFDHDDLIDNVSVQHNYDYYPNSADSDPHATNVAGIAAARGYNGKGVRGVAPWARFYSLNMLSMRVTHLSVILDAMKRHTTITAVSNNSWSPAHPFQPSRSDLRLWEQAINTGITEGFYGQGTVYVWSAGNSHCSEGICGIDSANYSGYANHYASVVVGAVDHQGTHNGSSEFGANLWLCAPSMDDKPMSSIQRGGITTTHRGMLPTYTFQFGGTSAVAPIVSGVVALMRQANPNLSWRDVKLVLANSARQNDPNDDGWAQGAVKYGSFSDDDDAQYHFNHKYGFGIVDAGKAVEMAGGWVNLPPPAPYMEVRNRNLNLELSADNPVINSSISVQSDINFIEYVEIPIIWTHPQVQNLSVKLISPSGTTSNLIMQSTAQISDADKIISINRGLWHFGSSRHLGEDASGVWKLRFEDTRATTGTLVEWGVRIRGYQIKMDAAAAVELSDTNVAATTLTLSLTGAKWKEGLQPNDFRLKNAPAGLRIENVRRTSDTQVQMNLTMTGNLLENYLFQVEATTGSVSNLSGSLASNGIRLNLITLRKNITIPDGTSGLDYSFTVEDIFASAQPLSYMVRGVPPGLEIEIINNNLVINGKPTVAGNYRLEVVVTRTDGIRRTEFFDFRILPTLRVQVRVLLEGALTR